MLILTKYIAKHELKPLAKYFGIKDILNGCKKVFKNLATEIKPPKKIDDARFFKVRIGGSVKGRMIVFIVTENNKIVPILIRLKKDKIFGKNMSPNNSAVIEQLNKNLGNVFEDLQEGMYEEFEIADHDDI